MEMRDIQRIEAALAVSLPNGYRDFLLLSVPPDLPDETTVIRDAGVIIEATLSYRTGFEGLPAWPDHWVYVGDEADACPYVIDCLSGKVIRTDKGNLHRPPLSEHIDFKSFVARVSMPELAGDSRPESFTDRVRFYLPVAIALFTMFIVFPLIAMAIRALYRMIF